MIDLKDVLHKIGIKTLDVDDNYYRDKYDLAFNPHDPLVSKGYSYHNGPEWSHMRMFHNIAYVRISLMNKKNVDYRYLKDEIEKIKHAIHNNKYSGLVELTNAE